MCVPALALAGCGVDAQQRTDSMSTSASGYARLAETDLGVPPTVGCGEGGDRVPIHVDCIEVFEDQEPFAFGNQAQLPAWLPPVRRA